MTQKRKMVLNVPSSPRRAASLSTPAIRISFATISLVFFVIIALSAEFVARYREKYRTTPPDFFPTIYYPHTRLQRALIPNTDYYGWFKINSLGFRGKEFSPEKEQGVFRIICLGGSTTLDVGSVGKDLSWPEVLEQELNQKFPHQKFEVINAGVGGYTSLDSLINFQLRIQYYNPDLVIFYHAYNDFNAVRASILGREVLSNLYPGEQKPRSSLTRWLQTNSLLYAKGIGKIKLGFKPTIMRWLRPQTYPIPSDWADRLQIETLRFRSNLNSFLVIARANNIDVILPEIIISYRDNLSDIEVAQEQTKIMRAYGGMNAKQAQEAYKIYNEAIAELASLYNIDFVKTSEFVPGGNRYFHDVIHFNGEGSRRMGRGLGKFLGRKFLQNFQNL